jgi:HD-GYP domain-containing protein (c-di-GMP phosphodiesterase class II)
MQRNLHYRKKLTKILAIGAVTLSIFVGIVVFFLGLTSTKHAIASLSLEQAVSLMTALAIHFTQAGEDHTAIGTGLRTLLLDKQAHLPNGHFVLGRVYTADGRLIAEERVAGSSLVPLAPPLDVRERIFAGDSEHEMLFAGKDVYVSILTPIPRAPQGYGGLFQGVYLVDKATLFRLARHALLAMAMCMIIVAAHTGFLYPTLASLNRQLVDLSSDLLDANLSMLETLGTAVAMRDGGTGAHNHRVTLYAAGLGEAIGLPPQEMRALIKGAFLHDVGKIGVSDSILLKADCLTPDEFNQIKSHVTQGLNVVRQSKWLADATVVVGGHHEKWDGSGYPRGLAGESIPLLARIFTIADVFDALASRRPYKPALSLVEAWEIMERGRNIHFDPELLDQFRSIGGTIYERVGCARQGELKTLLETIVQKYFP